MANSIFFKDDNEQHELKQLIKNRLRIEQKTHEDIIKECMTNFDGDLVAFVKMVIITSNLKTHQDRYQTYKEQFKAAANKFNDIDREEKTRKRREKYQTDELYRNSVRNQQSQYRNIKKNWAQVNEPF